MEVQITNEFCITEPISDDQLPTDESEAAPSGSAGVRPTSAMTLPASRAVPASVDASVQSPQDNARTNLNARRGEEDYSIDDEMIRYSRRSKVTFDSSRSDQHMVTLAHQQEDSQCFDTRRYPRPRIPRNPHTYNFGATALAFYHQHGEQTEEYPKERNDVDP